MAAEVLDKEPANPRRLTRPRPGHADLAGGQKFGVRDLRDILERASARETAARVACGLAATNRRATPTECDRSMSLIRRHRPTSPGNNWPTAHSSSGAVGGPARSDQMKRPIRCCGRRSSWRRLATAGRPRMGAAEFDRKKKQQ